MRLVYSGTKIIQIFIVTNIFKNNPHNLEELQEAISNACNARCWKMHLKICNGGLTLALKLGENTEHFL
jgi:hypothetical protein